VRKRKGPTASAELKASPSIIGEVKAAVRDADRNFIEGKRSGKDNRKRTEKDSGEENEPNRLIRTGVESNDRCEGVGKVKKRQGTAWSDVQNIDELSLNHRRNPG